MSAPLRIVRKKIAPGPDLAPPSGSAAAPRAEENFKDYLDRLLKLIPGEIVSLYMIGTGFIAAQRGTLLLVWTCVCLVLLIIVRYIGTSDRKNNIPPQYGAILISAAAFVIWIYWLGGIFAFYKIHDPQFASLLVLGWTFIVPWFYKG